jgi:ABC-type uncharacterized transport system permease subunit
MTGRVMSFFTLGTMGTTPIGGLISGLVIDAVDPRAAIGLGAVSLFASGAVVAVLLRRERTGTAGAEPEATAAREPAAETV